LASAKEKNIPQSDTAAIKAINYPHFTEYGMFGDDSSFSRQILSRASPNPLLLSSHLPRKQRNLAITLQLILVTGTGIYGKNLPLYNQV